MITRAYLFEAKYLQSYIFATNRLKEIVGASELLESLTNKLLDEVLSAVGGRETVKFSRRGGAAFYAFSTDAKAIDKLATLWPLVVRQYAPDLEFVQARGEGINEFSAFVATQPVLLAARNAPIARLPQATPPVERSRRTGEPAVAWDKKKDEPLDAATARKLDKKLKFWRGIDLGKRFAPQALSKEWPLNLTPESPDEDDNADGQGKPQDFPFIGDDNTIALIHADGNGLGQLLIKLGDEIQTRPDKYIAIFSGFSEAITKATQKAAQLATEEVLQPKQKKGVYPARPIVLGGDNLTMLVRSDLALAFTRSFLTHFALESGICLQALKKKFDLPNLPDRLTACAGIAYAKPSQPLYLLHGLAESLCAHAKKKSKEQDDKNVPTSLSFHRVTTSFINNYAEVLKRELTFDDLCQTLECYAVEPDQGLAMLGDLLVLRDLLKSTDFSKGANQELLGLIGRDRDQAVRQYRRWREVMNQRSNANLARFDKLLLALGITQASGDLPYSGSADSKIRHTPLGDVVMLIAAGDTCTVANMAKLETTPCT